MAFEFVRASSQRLSWTASSQITRPPITVACVVYGTNTTDQQYILGYGTAPDSALYFRADLTNDPLVFDSRPGSPAAVLSSFSNPSYNEWIYAAGAASSTSNTTIRVYRNGSVGTQPTSSMSSTLTPTTGFIGGHTSGENLDGRVAEAAVWNVELTADEITSLAKGFKPSRIRPQSLVFYAPLIRDLQDLRLGRAITNTNAATVAAHPRVY